MDLNTMRLLQPFLDDHASIVHENNPSGPRDVDWIAIVTDVGAIFSDEEGEFTNIT
jgi:hypothetical protein